jgi:hypothetical protein
MRANNPTITQIIYLVVPVGSAIYGMATHESYGMGLAICGILGGVLGFIAATLLVLVSAVVWSIICSVKVFDPNRPKSRRLT